MGFFKKIFSGKGNDANKQETKVSAVFTEKYFDERFTEQKLDEKPGIIDGCMKMVESFFMDNKIESKVKKPVNHPVNLDQAVTEGVGFHTYCKSFGLEDGQVILFLAYAFSEFLMGQYDFRLYKDNEPEFSLRDMTLKYNKNGVVLSLYPVEYALKVLNHESSFEDLYGKLNGHLERLPGVDELLQGFTGEKDPQ
ncbi:MAG: hypothetical protein K0R65_1720 [Crocinitomicaceae bacterium]|jgi:hypothetical protein|nr:hypothetical protein [Crocinitomicaceae bacterium]